MSRYKRRPRIGTRVMRPYGRQDYVDYGEIGTVTAHNANGTFQMTLDDYQPFYRLMWGSKSRPNSHAGMVHEVLGTSEVVSLVAAYKRNARRFRSIAKDWEANAKYEQERHTKEQLA